jgi:peptidoglycan/xylan/chitin deacetylase (PgdA/CDA1 family)
MRTVQRHFVRLLSEARAVVPPAPAPGLRILAFHAIGSSLPFRHYGISMSPACFEQAMAGLDPRQNSGLTDAVNRLDSPAALLALTFDDGYRDVLETAVPILRAHGLAASVFITAAFAASGAPLYLDRQSIVELSRDPGMEIGSHGATHRRLTECSDIDLRNELRDSRHQLEDWIGRPVRTLAYPHGAVDRRVRDAAEAAGYESACTSRFGVNRGHTDPLLLRRNEIVAADSLRVIRQKAEGFWDWKGRLRKG